MKNAVLIFPHQLFKSHPALEKKRDIFLVEEYLFFRQFKFHKQKLVFHRASMKFYEDFLQNKKLKVNYIDSTSKLSDVRKLIPYLKKIGIKEIHLADVVDNWLEKRIKQTVEKFGLKLNKYPSPCFLNSKNEIKEAK